MTSQGNGQPVVYQVKLSEQVKTALKQLHLQAAQAGTGQQFLSALHSIFERLRDAPLDFGETLYHLPALKLVVCHAILSPLVVDYAVHEELPLVFVRGFKVLS